MNAQGYQVSPNILYQDTANAIKMEKNGSNSCAGNSLHKGEVVIPHCPTYRMLADYFTKPLRGKSFLNF